MAFVVSVPIAILIPIPIPMPRFTNGPSNIALQGDITQQQKI